MIRIPLRITYRDGGTADVDATQYALAAYGIWCNREKLPQPRFEDGRTVELTDMHALRYWAWAELMRDKPHGVRASFEAWNSTVDEVMPAGEPAPADPTRTATPAAQSP